MHVIFFTVICLITPHIMAQPAQDGENREGREGRRGMRGGPGGPRGFGGPGGPGGPGRFGGATEEERQQWRERMERYRNATPAERANLRLEGMVEMTARNYDLNDAEKATVRHEMEAMQAERRAAMGADAEEYDRLREKMFEYWNRPREGGNAGGGDRPDWQRMRDNPEFRELQEKLRALDEKYPFDWQASVARVEKVIPPEKVAKGKARMEERRAQWQNRDRNRDGGQGRDREGRRNRGDRGDRQRRFESGSEPSTLTPPTAAAEPAKVEPILKTSKAVHPWEEYTNSFSARYKLDSAQIASAQSILKDSLTRATKLEQDDAARSGNAQTGKKSPELTAALDSIFKELKGRLDALLTAEQRTKG